MKLNHLSKKIANTLSEKKNLHGGLDKLAKEELDGVDLKNDTENDNTDIFDLDITNKDPELNQEQDKKPDNPVPLESSSESGYNLNDVKYQLKGMIEKWFKLAQNIDPNKKEAFLKLGDRLSEIASVISSEFING